MKFFRILLGLLALSLFSAAPVESQVIINPYSRVQAWTPEQDASRNILWFNVANRYTLFQQSHPDATTASYTPVAAVGDPIGFVQDRAKGYSLIASSDARRGTWYLDTDGVPMIATDGSNDNMVFVNTQKYLGPLTALSPSWHGKFKLKRAANGGTQIIFSSDTGSGSKVGVYLGLKSLAPPAGS